MSCSPSSTTEEWCDTGDRRSESLCLRFLIYPVGIMVSTSWDCHEAQGADRCTALGVSHVTRHLRPPLPPRPSPLPPTPPFLVCFAVPSDLGWSNYRVCLRPAGSCDWRCPGPCGHSPHYLPGAAAASCTLNLPFTAAPSAKDNWKIKVSNAKFLKTRNVRELEGKVETLP